MPFGIGIWEMLILLLVLLLVFGPKRLPEMGRSLGKGMREFKDTVTGNDEKSPFSALGAIQAAEPVDESVAGDHDELVEIDRADSRRRQGGTLDSP